jgi:FtsP/CotA-like multicopper oxidase with cupredoxin domain
MFRFLAAALIPVVMMFPAEGVTQPSQTGSESRIRTYYVAADEVEWDYAPGGINKMMGMKFEGTSKVFTEQGPHRIGTVYRKALYREYTDATFTKLKPRAPEWEHTGILGPILRAEVGDTIRVVFKNNATHPYSMHPHGVFYDKSSEGALYEDGTSGPVCTSKMQTDFYKVYDSKVDATLVWYGAHLPGFKKTHAYVANRSQDTFYNADGTLAVSVTGSSGKLGENAETYSLIYSRFQPALPETTIIGVNQQRVICQ